MEKSKIQQTSSAWGDHVSDKRQVELASLLQELQLNGADSATPFAGKPLTGADIYWLLSRVPAGHLRLEKANLSGAHLQGARLSHINLQNANMIGIHLEKADLTEADLQGANLSNAHLQNASLIEAHLEDATLTKARLEGADLTGAYLQGANLRRVILNEETHLTGVILVNKQYGTAALGDIQWGGVDLTQIKWEIVSKLGDEQKIYELSTHNENKLLRLQGNEKAVRAHYQLATVLQNQGLNEVAARFTYQAKCLERRVRWYKLICAKTLSQRILALGNWMFSWFLFVIAGYGYRLRYCLLWYICIIGGFMLLYLFLEPSHFTWQTALAESINVFHGRGVAPNIDNLTDPNLLALLTSIEACMGLVIEVVLVATLIQRFFGK